MTSHLFFTIERQILRQQRARTDKTHFSLEYIEQLRQFVKTVCPDNASNPGDPLRIVQFSSVLFRFHPHRPKLVDLENLTFIPRPFLHKKSWPFSFDLNGCVAE